MSPNYASTTMRSSIKDTFAKSPCKVLCLDAFDDIHALIATYKEEHQQQLDDVTLHTIVGVATPRSIQIQGQIHEVNLQVLIDSNSNLNFILDRWICYLKLLANSSSKLKVLIGNGNAITCQGVYRQIPLMFGVDLHVLPIHNADMIFDIAWLQTLG